MISIIVGMIGIVVLGIYFLELRKSRFKTKEIVIIGVLSAAAFILSQIKFIRYPQGGGITLFYMLPIMLLSYFYGIKAGITSGILVGLLSVLSGGMILHPAQFLLDYILSNVFIGFAGIFGCENRIKMSLGAFVAFALGVFMCILSGVYFFGQYAPEGMNVWIYSIIYNVSSMGVEGLLTIIVLNLLPIKRLKEVALGSS